MKTARMIVPLLALAVAAVAQPVAAAKLAPAAQDSVVNEAIGIKVVNRNWMDMRIYAVVDGRRIRLGTVSGFTTEKLKLRRNLVGPTADLELQAVPIGHRTLSHIARIVAFRGDQLEFRVESSLGTSFVRRI